LPILVRIFSKFRAISQIWEYRERRNLQVNTLRVNVAIYLGKKPGKYPDKYTVIPGKAFTGYLT